MKELPNCCKGYSFTPFSLCKLNVGVKIWRISFHRWSLKDTSVGIPRGTSYKIRSNSQLFITVMIFFCYRSIGENTDVFNENLLDDFQVCNKNSRFKTHVIPVRKQFNWFYALPTISVGSYFTQDIPNNVTIFVKPFQMPFLMILWIGFEKFLDSLYTKFY